MEIFLRLIVTQSSGEVNIAFAIRNSQLCDELLGPVLGLYTHLVHCGRRIRCRIQGKGHKRPYIEQGSRRNRGVMPEIAWGGVIFVAPLGSSDLQRPLEPGGYSQIHQSTPHEADHLLD